MQIVSRQAEEFWVSQGEMLEQNYQQGQLDHAARKPASIEVQQLAEDQPPLEFGPIVVLPGWWYGYENGKEIAISPADIGPDGFWIEAPA